MVYQLTDWWQFLPMLDRIRTRRTLDEVLLEADRVHLTEHFRRRGYLNATVSLSVAAPEMKRSGSGAEAKRQRRRHATFSVQLGDPHEVLAVKVNPAGLEPDLVDVLLDTVVAVPGMYDGLAVDETLAAWRDELDRRGYARSEPGVVLVPSSPGSPRGELHFDVLHSEPVLVGLTGVQGAEHVDARRLSRRFGRVWPVGTAFDGAAMRDGSDAISRLDAFESARFMPDTAVPGPLVPVRLQVMERPKKEVNPALSANTAGGFFSLGAGVTWHLRHLGGTLATASGRTVGGYIVHPQSTAIHGGDFGPMVDHEVTFDVPVAPLIGLSYVVSNRANMSVETGYHSARGEVSTGLVWRPEAGVELGLTYHLDGWVFFPFPGQEGRFNDVFAAAGPRPPGDTALDRRYAVHFPQIAVLADFRNDPDLPTSGVYGQLNLVPVMFERGDLWFRAEAELRGYVPVLSHNIVFAGLVRGGFMYRWDEEPDAGLLGHRFHLGGGPNLRGWTRHRAAPPGFQGDVRQVQPGGNVQLMASAEMRWRIWRGIWGTAFFDVGRVWAYLLDQPEPDQLGLSRGVHLIDLVPTAGTGLYIPTPIGVVRMDLAFRLKPVTDIADPGFPVVFHLLFGPAF